MVEENPPVVVVDTLTLRFVGRGENGADLHQLRAEHVAEVLQGLAGLAADFDAAGAFDVDGPANSEILVRAPREGSFIIDVQHVVTETAAVVEAVGGVTGALGLPTLAGVIFYATKSARADVKDATRIEGTDLVKITWQDDTIDEVPVKVWDELKVRKRRRKKHLRALMAPIGDSNVAALEVIPGPNSPAPTPEQPVLELRRADYDAVRPETEVEETDDVFDVEARMSAIDFDDPAKWRVSTVDVKRGAVMEDEAFLVQVADGLAIRKDDIFDLRIREDRKTTDGRTRSTWTVLKVLKHRRTGDNDTTASAASTA
ncbi:hypothetical protein [Curtobacterium sp. MCBD17_026]|uniref:hypothetical protein n=1 Tax=Curtobacterium sp. MCBD17_026 TaxID=2175621 RepID=UPI000DA8E9F2|nr:hypothetical protein [Curtobacterium sp. MCBD17_026]WIB69789.1 hypothetical protein DEI85_11510 [Curtobacterium sp. MCBD17_026]